MVVLSPHMATTLALDHVNHSQPCRVELRAPSTYHISMLYVLRKRALERMVAGNKPSQQCLLTISHGAGEGKSSVDLCSYAALEPTKYTELLPPTVLLEWQHTGLRSDDALAKELVFAALGRGQEVCSDAEMFPCIARPHYSVYCITTALVCDGHRNCPYSGNDEDETLCAAELSRMPLDHRPDDLRMGLVPEGHGPEDFRLGQGLHFFATEMLRKFIISKNASKRGDAANSTTDKSTVLWFEEDTGHRHSESLPNVLNHYGPWGYLMLGMLICGTVLMFCGLWECCCRRPKEPPSATLLIINQGAQGAEGLEVPATPSPPRYEDLDQPPTYSSLFPVGKAASSTASTPEPPEAPRSEIFTIDVPVPDTRPKP